MIQAGTSVATIASSLKVLGVLDRQVPQFYLQDWLFSQIKTRTAKVTHGGRKLEASLGTRPSASGGFVSELQQNPEADEPKSMLVEVGIKEFVAAMQISWRADKISQGNRRSYIEALANDMNSTVESAGQTVSRQLYGDSSAAMAVVKTITADTPVAGQHTIVLEPDQGVSADHTFGAAYFMRGGRISASASKTGTAVERALSGTIVAANKATDTIIITGDLGAGATALTVGDYLFLGSKEVPSKGQSILGLFNVVANTGTYLTLNRATAGNEFWQSDITSTFGGKDWEAGVQAIGDRVNSNIGGETQLIVMSKGVWRSLANKLRSERRFDASSSAGDRRTLGTKALTYDNMVDGEVPIYKDRDVPKGTTWGLNMSNWYMGVLAEQGWIMEHGETSPFHREPGFRIWQAMYGWMGEVFCLLPARQWLIEGITEG